MNFQNYNHASNKEGKQAATQTEDVGQSAVDPWVFMQAKTEVRVSADSEFHDSPRHP